MGEELLKICVNTQNWEVSVDIYVCIHMLRKVDYIQCIHYISEFDSFVNFVKSRYENIETDNMIAPRCG